MKGLYTLNRKFQTIGVENCYISEISLAELKYGVENSQHRGKNQKVLDDFLTGVQVLPIYEDIDIYAKEKARLKKAGKPVDDFDLLIGATAVSYHLTMVTNNVSHFERIKGIRIEDWTK